MLITYITKILAQLKRHKIRGNRNTRQMTVLFRTSSNRGATQSTSLSVILLLVGMFLLFYFYRSPIKVFAKESVENYGFPALFVVCWLADALIQPVPPDAVVFGTAFGGASIWKTAFVAGAASAFGGTTGYLLGRIFGPWRFRRLFGSKYLRLGRDLFRDH
ncbi:MAG: hypothetical protein ACD_39C00800G0001, partial [uncultured bacterium]